MCVKCKHLYAGGEEDSNKGVKIKVPSKAHLVTLVKEALN